MLLGCTRKIAIICLLAPMLSGLALVQIASAEDNLTQCKAELKDNVLTLENSRIRRTFEWNNGHLVSRTVEDRQAGEAIRFNSAPPDFTVPGLNPKARASQGRLNVEQAPATSTRPAHLRAEVFTRLNGLQVRRSFIIYPDCPAIACTWYLRGEAPAGWTEKATTPETFRHEASINTKKVIAPTLDRLALPGTHWRLKGVRFTDVTDRYNTLVQESAGLLFRLEGWLEGNILFADAVLKDQGLFMLKESPPGFAQTGWPGVDFIYDVRGGIRAVGVGILPENLKQDEWVRGYGVVTGIYRGGELGRLTALREYQKKIRIRAAGRDEMVLMNTWGDRGMGRNISEKFCLAELEAAKRLGISHFQIDAGWGNPWEGIEKKKFPNGLGPVAERAKQLGIKPGLWFSLYNKKMFDPQWMENLTTGVLKLYRDHGFATFKADFCELTDKAAEVNLRRMFDRTTRESNGEIVYNLDITNDPRYGYHFFNEYGNYFLENRYTDWGAWYPHWTLRNAWMLSRYVPAETLQLEFLSKWRNADKYEKDDPLAPHNVPWDYIFATAMAGQPLAWFEASKLPEEAFEIAPLIKKYREVQHAFHQGVILPIGEEPSGVSWTGFQSVGRAGGYLLVYREHNERAETKLQLYGLAGKKITCEHVLGHGKDFTANVGEDGTVKFALPGRFTFALYRYH